MASTLACLGLDVDDLDALGGHLERLPGKLVGRAGGVETVRYADASGSRVTIGRLDGGVVDLVASYDAIPGAVLAELSPLGELTVAEVVEDGVTVARLACDLEQRRHLVDDAPAYDASVVALGIDMTLHADTEAFVAHGLHADAVELQPTAYLAGTVLHAESRTHGVTGQAFYAVRVRTVGFEATVCLAASEHPQPPDAGAVVAGLAYLVVDIPTLWSV